MKAVLSGERVNLGLSRAGEHVIRRRMARGGLTVTDLAARLGASRKHVSQILNGGVPLTGDLAVLLPRAAAVSPELVAALLRRSHDVTGFAPGFAKGWVELHVEPTAPLPEWEAR